MATPNSAPLEDCDSSNANVDVIRVLDNPRAIHVGHGLATYLASDLAQAVAAAPPSKVVIVTDANVAKLPHLDALRNALRAAWKRGGPAGKGDDEADDWLLTYVMPAGEQAKHRGTKARIEDWMLARACTRDTLLIALGGGVVGDLAGFVAATYMRGLRCVQVPTTLLAMVDSAIGGKTALDVPAGKNLIGAFHQPLRIYIDTALLHTLPERHIRNGMAEIVKTAAFWSAEDFALLEADPDGVVAAMASGDAHHPLVRRIVAGGARIKAHVVTEDEREGGLRSLLNFGHTIGHAIEAALGLRLLHGECVAMGMVYEAEIARHLGHLADAPLGRLVRCIAAYGLPTSLGDKVAATYLGADDPRPSVAQLMEYMNVDKKTVGKHKRLVLLKAIGESVEKGASRVSDTVIRLVISPGVQVHPIALPAAPASDDDVPLIEVRVPGSKSISNRALVLAALSQGAPVVIHNLLLSDDTQVMLSALQRLGACTYSWAGDVLTVQGGGGTMQAAAEPIYLGNAGTAARFLTAVTALAVPAGGNVTNTLTGNARMRQRPIGPLVTALRGNDCNVEFLGKEGCLPVKVPALGALRGGRIELSASVSSQFVSAILLCAPYAKEEVVLDLVGGKVISQAYIDMTIAMMAKFGIQVRREGNVYTIPRGVYTSPGTYTVEPDASSATYPLAVAAITGRRVRVPHLGCGSLQGDAAFAPSVLAPMGCTVTQTEGATEVCGPEPGHLRPRGDIDCEPLTDAFLTVAAVAAVAAAGGAQQGGCTTITGIANQRVKECNRIRAVIDELAKFGVKTEELDDGLRVFAQDHAQVAKHNPVVHCYDDHRVAMAFSVLGCLTGCVLAERKCVEKTWPAWWDTLGNTLQVQVSGADIDPKEHGHASCETESAASQPKSVVVIGMRGAGKSTLGAAAARRLGRVFVDLDAEFTRAHGEIRAFVAAHGWPAFRDQERVVLAEALAVHPRGAVIACGGGIVETGEARDALAKCGLPVVHVMRDVSDIVADLKEAEHATADQRPAWGEPLLEVWARRAPWYAQCATTEFYAVRQGQGQDATYAWDAIGDQFARFIKALEVPCEVKSCAVAGHDRKAQAGTSTCSSLSSFVSLTAPRVADVFAKLPRIEEGTDAIELRADLLADKSVNAVGSEYFSLTQAVDLPVIFTVRTQGQAGTWPDADTHGASTLLRAALRWGVQVLDVEIELPDAESICAAARKANAVVLTSYHDKEGRFGWEADKDEWLTRLQRAAQLGDICKLVGRAKKVSDNLDLAQFVREQSTTIRKPLIAINMGEEGKMSRILNATLTPVTHPLLPSAAAPGQLSVPQIHEGRHMIGQLPRKNFYLFGSPIARSKSPIMHNTGFQTLGLPYMYFLHEAVEPTHLGALLRDAEFGGASVTIPLKETIRPLLDEETPAARAIGAVNTILVKKSVDGKHRLVGDNTDYQGIQAALRKRLDNVAADATGSENQIAHAVVLGAGGTARAAVYALLHLGAKHVHVANRTRPRAETLASDFRTLAAARGAHVSAVALGDLEMYLSQRLPDGATAVVSTLPRDAQAQVDSLLPPALFSSTRALLEMVYGAPLTPFQVAARAAMGSQGKDEAHVARRMADGAEVLIEQGLVQFELWTGMRAPRQSIEMTVNQAFAKSASP